MTPGQVAQAQQLLGSIGGKWFDNNPLASEYLDVKNWSRWDWVQIGGVAPLTTPLQVAADTSAQNFTPGVPAQTSQQPTGPFTFLCKIHGQYALELDKKRTVGKPATNTVLYVRQDEIHIKLYIITPFDLAMVVALLPFASAIFPPGTNQGVSKIVQVLHPKLAAAGRSELILTSMGYIEEPEHGNPGYVDTIWVPQDSVGGDEQNQVVTIDPIGITPLLSSPASTAATATPPSAPNPDYFNGTQNYTAPF